jgi:hypothetical protein
LHRSGIHLYLHKYYLFNLLAFKLILS